MNKFVKSELSRLRPRAAACGAMQNFRDAEHDLFQWPDLYKEILDDLVQCIIAREKPAPQPAQEVRE